MFFVCLFIGVLIYVIVLVCMCICLCMIVYLRVHSHYTRGRSLYVCLFPVYLSLYLFVYVRVFICQLYLSVLFVCGSVWLFNCNFMCVCLCIWFFNGLSVCVSVYLRVHPRYTRGPSLSSGCPGLRQTRAWPAGWSWIRTEHPPPDHRKSGESPDLQETPTGMEAPSLGTAWSSCQREACWAS